MEDTLTIPRLKAMHDEWRRHPPMQVMFAAWLGVGEHKEGTHEDLVERIRVMQGAI